ncbi:MAG: hypothetical protein ACOY3L_13110 [Pseudomonadota bacterium]
MMRDKSRIARGSETISSNRRRNWAASIRIGLLSGAMLLALLVLSVPRVAESLGLEPPPGLVNTAQLELPAGPHH